MGQFSKANVGLDFNDAIKKLCGTFRTYRILNTIAKFNVKLYAIINHFDTAKELNIVQLQALKFILSGRNSLRARENPQFL